MPSLFEKVWSQHQVIAESVEHPATLYVDLHLLHEVTSPQAFSVLKERGLKVRRPERCLATIDHSTPTLAPDSDGQHPYVTDQAKKQVETLLKNCQEFGIELHGWDSPQRGVIHVFGPEMGAVKPGMTIVCGDSHTSTHGAFGALAFGIGTSEVGHVLATQCLLQRKPKSMLIKVNGELPESSSAKDLILAIIGQIGVDGGTGYVLEYAGSAIEKLSMEERMTVCNMSIEAGARAGMIAPDQKTIDFLEGREKAPKGKAWDAAVKKWLSLASDSDSQYDNIVEIDASKIVPQITFGTHPGMETAIDQPLPDSGDDNFSNALEYMQFAPGESILGQKVDVVFIGSCTNSRLSDLQAAARIMQGQKVSTHVRALIVPGSEKVKTEAEALGLDRIFTKAGAEWREPGCSMCIAMNGDKAMPGQLVVSTSNRNFVGRQGPGARTVLASPQTAAASAIRGVISDPREF
ncbi:MAG: 3-isopropylmalate dehydratase large subunit [bacterium]